MIFKKNQTAQKKTNIIDNVITTIILHLLIFNLFLDESPRRASTFERRCSLNTGTTKQDPCESRTRVSREWAGDVNRPLEKLRNFTAPRLGEIPRLSSGIGKNRRRESTALITIRSPPRIVVISLENESNIPKFIARSPTVSSFLWKNIQAPRFPTLLSNNVTDLGQGFSRI